MTTGGAIARGAVALVVVGWLVSQAGSKSQSPANTPTPVMGTAFTTDGFTIKLTSLRRVQQIDASLASLPGTQLWILGVETTNNTNGEADVGTGFRLQDDQGQIVSANFISAIHPDLDAKLAQGGKAAGFLSFSLASGRAPVAVLVKPGSKAVTVRLSYAPWPSAVP